MAETGVDYAQIWQQTLGTLDSGLSNQERAFVRLCRLVGVLDQIALVRAPNSFTKDFLETRVREQIHSALADQLGHPVQVAVSVDESLETDLGMISDEPTGQVHDGRRQAGSDGSGAGHHNGMAPAGGGFGGPAAHNARVQSHQAQNNALRDLAESAPALNGADLDEPARPAYPDVQTQMELGPDPLS
ncbi:MAG: chromosomal replication initiation protein DnaA, partial [Terrabacter sp.]